MTELKWTPPDDFYTFRPDLPDETPITFDMEPMTRGWLPWVHLLRAGTLATLCGKGFYSDGPWMFRDLGEYPEGLPFCGNCRPGIGRMKHWESWHES